MVESAFSIYRDTYNSFLFTFTPSDLQHIVNYKLLKLAFTELQ